MDVHIHTNMSMYSQQKSLSNFALTHVLLVALLARLKAVPLVPALSHVEVSTTPASLVRDISISATDKPTCPQITPRDAQHFGSGFASKKHRKIVHSALHSSCRWGSPGFSGRLWSVLDLFQVL